MKNVYTTGEVAKICNVTIRTVIKWFESGELGGFKIPNSRDRRIPR
jgi:excisionase family DNA binding protein